MQFFTHLSLTFQFDYITTQISNLINILALTTKSKASEIKSKR